MLGHARRPSPTSLEWTLLAVALALHACAPSDDTAVSADDDVATPLDVTLDSPATPPDARGDSPATPADRPTAPDADVPVTCPMPPPDFIVQSGRCVPSCLAAGGNLCNVALCAGRARIGAYDCDTCCATPPSNCGGIPSRWVCTSDGRGRQHCATGQVQTEACALSCLPGTATTDAACGTAPSVCTGSASGSSPVWTCTGDHRSRQRCAAGVVLTESCTNGCVENPVGLDDACASAPASCAGSASGTSPIWTCTSDGRSRQRCAAGVVLTEACASGCVARPLGTDDVCGTSASGCAGSASGTSPIWTCTSDQRSRQRCAAGSLLSETCAYGCIAMPTGVDDTCAPMPTPGGGSGMASCALPQWWNLPYSWDPGHYAVRYGVDSDLRMTAGTAVQLRHASRLLAEDVYGWGWMPEFTDTVTGYRFRFLHLQPSRRLLRSIGTVYPAGTLVGYSGGNTPETGYPTYSTGAHLCVQTVAPYRSAFPTGTDPCN